jgi:hypothetical protein
MLSELFPHCILNLLQDLRFAHSRPLVTGRAKNVALVVTDARHVLGPPNVNAGNQAVWNKAREHHHNLPSPRTQGS